MLALPALLKGVFHEADCMLGARDLVKVAGAGPECLEA